MYCKGICDKIPGALKRINIGKHKLEDYARCSVCDILIPKSQLWRVNRCPCCHLQTSKQGLRSGLKSWQNAKLEAMGLIKRI